MIKQFISLLVDLFLFPFLFLLALIARYKTKRIAVGIGPEPLINNVYHKLALEKYGYTAETFVSHVYYITTHFEIRVDQIIPSYYLRLIYLYIRAIFTYKCLYFYFNGGPLGFTVFLWRWEPFFYKLAKVKMVVMSYGADVQDMTRCPNLLFRQALYEDYPQSRLKRKRIVHQIDLWSAHADHIICGSDWVDYFYYWNTLMLSHLAIDTEKMYRPLGITAPFAKTFTIFHAPNHRHIKGTQFLLNSVDELKQAGYDVELIILERVSNERVQEEIAKADLIVDQLIIGWYGMVAIEAMAMGKPVVCYLREDLLKLYITAGLLQAEEIPVIDASPLTLTNTLKYWIENRTQLKNVGKRSQEFIAKHHSIESVGKVFAQINQKLAIG